MFQSLGQTIGLNIDWSFAFAFGGLIMMRIAMVLSVIPFLVGKPVPAPIRMGLVFILVLYLYPALEPADHALLPKAPLALIVLYMKEAFYGAALGIAASIIFHAFEAAGSLVDNQRGAAQARLLIPALGEQSSLFGNFNYLFGITLFLVIGGHVFFLRSIVNSYLLLPILEIPKSRPDLLLLSEEFIKVSGSVLLLALQLTAPIMISIFVADIILGIMNKAAPQINVQELGYAIRGAIGVLVYFISVGLVASQMEKISMGMIDTIDRIVQIFALGVGSS